MSTRPHVHKVIRWGSGVYESGTVDLRVFWPQGSSYEDVLEALMSAVEQAAEEMSAKFGCCDDCGGKGTSIDVETNGQCWTCRGTGHPHTGVCNAQAG